MNYYVYSGEVVDGVPSVIQVKEQIFKIKKTKEKTEKGILELICFSDKGPEGEDLVFRISEGDLGKVVLVGESSGKPILENICLITKEERLNIGTLQKRFVKEINEYYDKIFRIIRERFLMQESMVLVDTLKDETIKAAYAEPDEPPIKEAAPVKKPIEEADPVKKPKHSHSDSVTFNNTTTTI